MPLRAVGQNLRLRFKHAGEANLGERQRARRLIAENGYIDFATVNEVLDDGRLLELLDFLERLAPFSSSKLVLRDPQPQAHRQQ